MRIRKKLGLLIAIGASSCMATKPPKPLDATERAELAAIRERLIARDVRVVAPLCGEDWWMDRRILRAFEEARIPVHERADFAKDSDVTLQVRRERGRSGGTFLAMASTVTLGIVPYSDDNEETFHVSLSAPHARIAETSIVDASPALFGWWAPVLAATSDEWETGGGSRSDASEEALHSARIGLALARVLDGATSEVTR